MTPPACPLTTVHYGLEPPSNGGPRGVRAERPTALAVARLVRQKGLDVLVEAMPSVLERVPDAQVLLAGEGPQRSELESAIAARGLEDHVVLLGHRDDVPALMRSAWVMVHPTRWEGFGLVFLEAMSQGLPIIASGVSAIPEIVRDGETGTVIPPEDPVALSDALVELLTDKERRQRYAAAGSERLRTAFSPARMADETAAIYTRAVETT
jgi:glycosyltransferase involved in cell wall biosynthesis